MEMSKLNLYKATNVGGLMIEDSIKVFNYLYLKDKEPITESEIEQVLAVKSATSRKRIFEEIRRRYEMIDLRIITYFIQAERNEQTVIIFYAALKLYRLLNDVVFEILIPKYKRNESSVNAMDILSLLDSKATAQEHIAKWSITTRKNMTYIILKMLKEAGIQYNNHIKPLQASDDLWRLIVETGDVWMLQAALLSKEQQQQLLNYSDGI